MRTLSETLNCDGLCPECPVSELGSEVVDSVNTIVDTARRDPLVDSNHDDFEENVAGIGADVLSAQNIPEEHLPAAAAAATRVLMNECAPAPGL